MLPDIIFSNNLGSYTFERCLVSISDQWNWNGSSVKNTKIVTITGHIKRSDFQNTPEGWDALLTTGSEKGKEGTLQLPWTTLEGIKVTSFGTQSNTWIDYVPFSATFADENPNGNVYTLHFFDIELHNPRLSLPIHSRRVFDEHTHFPNNVNTLTTYNPRNQRIRYESGFRMMEIALSGTMLLEEPILPEGLIEKLKMQKGSFYQFDGIPLNNLPVGYPNPFPLSTAIPELDGININNVILTNCSLTWDLENQSANVSMTMTAQPQRFVL